MGQREKKKKELHRQWLSWFESKSLNNYVQCYHHIARQWNFYNKERDLVMDMSSLRTTAVPTASGGSGSTEPTSTSFLSADEQERLELMAIEEEEMWKEQHKHNALGPSRAHIYDEQYEIPADVTAEHLRMMIADVKDEIKGLEKDITMLERKMKRKQAQPPPSTEGLLLILFSVISETT